jgi:hypothetical protein
LKEDNHTTFLKVTVWVKLFLREAKLFLSVF